MRTLVGTYLHLPASCLHLPRIFALGSHFPDLHRVGTGSIATIRHGALSSPRRIRRNEYGGWPSGSSSVPTSFPLPFPLLLPWRFRFSSEPAEEHCGPAVQLFQTPPIYLLPVGIATRPFPVRQENQNQNHRTKKKVRPINRLGTLHPPAPLHTCCCA